jgi:hypothetical protein
VPSIDSARWDLPALAASWRAARPFPHVVIDGLVGEAGIVELCQAIAAEPHWPNRGEIFDMMGSAEEPQHPVLRSFHQSLEACGPAIQAITGKPVRSADMRSYVYLAGSYLLPHSDCQKQLGRLVAYAYYVWTQGCRGGELELFDVTLENGRAVSTRPAGLIEARADRLVLFEVNPATLHQVREVEAGARLSLSGWFHA